MMRLILYRAVILTLILVLAGVNGEISAQINPESAPDTIPPMPSFEERASKWGPNDTIVVGAIWYQREMLSYKEESTVWVSKLSAKKLQKFIAEYNRLRNAVYVTYPYARTAGATINDINNKLNGVTSKKARKDYLKSREQELRKQFSDPLSNLSVYQGKVLMKLINRQTGNNCYEIIKEYKGGFNARVYQTVAFFFGSNLKQKYDLEDKTDRQIENFVNEIDGNWYNNAYRK